MASTWNEQVESRAIKARHVFQVIWLHLCLLTSAHNSQSHSHQHRRQMTQTLSSCKYHGKVADSRNQLPYVITFDRNLELQNPPRWINYGDSEPNKRKI